MANTCLGCTHGVLWWLMMSQNVSWCLMVAHGVSKCLMVMTHGVLWWLMMSQNVSWWLMVSQNVSWCLKMSHEVSKWLMMSQNGSWCLKMAHDVSKWVMVSYDGSWCLKMKYLGTELLRHSPCRVKPTQRDSTWELSCVNGYILQCQSSSGSVGKSIWPAFRRPRFKSWLDLMVFFHQMSHDVSKCLMVSYGGSWCLNMSHGV